MYYIYIITAIIEKVTSKFCNVSSLKYMYLKPSHNDNNVVRDKKFDYI